MKLIIGNKNYSSWSLRPWLLLTAFHIEFDEIQESLLQERIKDRLGKHSPSSKVPVLVDGDLTVWDSLAICEYISEKYLSGGGWPAQEVLRAEARAVCAEMHAGFMNVRGEMPMNCRALRRVVLSEAAQSEVARIDSIWSECMGKHNGPWLFGRFSIADCFFAPVALRFKTYGVWVSEHSRGYQSSLLNHDAVNNWVDAAKLETEIVPEDEAGSPR